METSEGAGPLKIEKKAAGTSSPIQGARIREMFNRIALRYDLLNGVMTFGRDRSWRRFVIQQARVPRGGKLLDVATGTGHIAAEAVRQVENGTVLGADFAFSMISAARLKHGEEPIVWASADALHLPFSDNTFDAVTSGFLARNVADLKAMFREQLRVVQPGGRVVCLDTSPPPHTMVRPVVRLYLRWIIPYAGHILAGDRAAYRYLSRSTEAFHTPEQIADVMQHAGLHNVSFRTFMFGTIVVHWGTK